MGAGVPGGGGILDPDGALERVAAWRGRTEELATATTVMSDRLRELRVTLADDNGLTEVTLDSTGVLVDLRLGQRIHRVAPEVLSRTIMDTIRAARQQLADRSKQIIAETVGTESVAARAIVEAVARQLHGPEAGADQADDRRSGG